MDSWIVYKINPPQKEFYKKITTKLKTMSVGNPKKFDKLKAMAKAVEESAEESTARVYKRKNQNVKKALGFKTDEDKPQLG